MMAVIAVRPFITTRNFRTLVTAFSNLQLDPLLDKCWWQLNWLNRNTDGGMKRLRQKVDNMKQKRSSRVDSSGQEFGRMSEIEGIVADTSDKVRGDRVDRLIFEESGSNKHLIESWIKGNALVELGGKKFGIRVAGGTGGDSGPNLAGLSKIFSNPDSYNVLMYRHNDTDDGGYMFTGFFIPAHKFSLLDEYLDKRGVTNSKSFKKYYTEQRKKLSGTDLISYCAEHCFTPSEALLRQGENMFDSVALSDRLTQIRILKQGVKPKPMALLWDRSDGEENIKIKSVESRDSKLLIYEEPLMDLDGSPFTNLYVAGIDAIDQGREDSSTDRNVSDFCIVIKRRMYGLQEPKYVAIYKDRPRDIREAYDIALKLLTWYNCKALLEHTKISIITYFKEKKKLHLFMKRPASTASITGKTNTQMIGAPATENVIKHGLELINNFINDYCYSMDMDEMLEQLLKYSYENKTKFDIVASMEMCEIADEELMNIKPKPKNSVNNQWQDIGWTTDENGYKQFGVIKNEFSRKGW